MAWDRAWLLDELARLGVKARRVAPDNWGDEWVVQVEQPWFEVRINWKTVSIGADLGRHFRCPVCGGWLVMPRWQVYRVCFDEQGYYDWFRLCTSCAERHKRTPTLVENRIRLGQVTRARFDRWMARLEAGLAQGS
jgi:hypothetical protein